MPTLQLGKGRRKERERNAFNNKREAASAQQLEGKGSCADRIKYTLLKRSQNPDFGSS